MSNFLITHLNLDTLVKFSKINIKSVKIHIQIKQLYFQLNFLFFLLFKS